MEYLRALIAIAIAAFCGWLLAVIYLGSSEIVITDGPARELTALNAEGVGGNPEDRAAWDRFIALVREPSDYVEARRNSSEPSDAKPADWPGAIDWPADYGRSLDRTPDPLVTASCARAIEDLRQRGMFDRLARARQERSRPVYQYSENGEPLMYAPMHHIGYSRHVTRLNGARMRLALERGDETEFHDAAMDTFWLARCNAQGGSLGALASVAMRMYALAEIRHAIREHRLSDRTLAQLDELIGDPIYRTDMERGLRSERVLQADYLQRCFTDNGRGNGHLARAPDELGDHPFKWLFRGPIGAFFAGSRRDHEREFDAIARLARRRLHARSLNDAIDEEDDAGPHRSVRLTLVWILEPTHRKSATTTIQAEAQHNGTRLMIALERYQRAHGEYPTRLTQLVPNFVGHLDPEPISGDSWCYRSLEAPDDHGRSYLLYSLGADETDDGGKHSEYAATRTGNFEGFDYVINAPRD